MVNNRTETPSAKQMCSGKPAFIEIDDAMKLWVLNRGDINLNDSIIIERVLTFARIINVIVASTIVSVDITIFLTFSLWIWRLGLYAFVRNRVI